jgi:predicted GIY-YIG superfamily endonuclease
MIWSVISQLDKYYMEVPSYLGTKRDTYNYNLYDGKKKVYVGITDNPDRREQEHIQDNKRFTRMDVQKPAVSRNTALEREQEALERFQRSHGGRTPKYND